MENAITKASSPTEKVIFCGDVYNYTENEDGSKHLFTDKNSRGFKMNIRISGDERDHEIANEALKNFFVKGNL
ncbi:hypothetical protein [Paenibacillus sp. M2]|uniref:hypothetical protein n=1 Tax=Paenibacillus sp. M2 TaxID=3341793 RepID=UPI003988BC1A